MSDDWVFMIIKIFQEYFFPYIIEQIMYTIKNIMSCALFEKINVIQCKNKLNINFSK